MFWIRADGNAKIGAGHIMRCLTIAEALAQRVAREEILFLCAAKGSAELVRRHGFAAVTFGTDYLDMESELPLWRELCGEHKPCGHLPSDTVILVDSYAVTERYLEALRAYGRVVLMDDLGKKKYPVWGVINYNAPARGKVYRQLYAGTDTRQFIGSGYVPIREQFLQRAYCVQEQVRSVLITTGGGDWDNIAGKILDCLYREKLSYHLVVGQFNPHFAALKEREAAHPNIHIHSNVDDMAGLMLTADIAITAGGSTIYELAALGVPFICFSYAENQEPLTEYIGEQKIAGFAGAFHREPEATLQQLELLFEELAADRGKRSRCYEAEKRLVDGQGAARLALALIEQL